MAPIPLFTGRVGSDLAPNSGAFDRLDPTLFAKGAEAAKFAPSTAGAIAEGVTSGVNEYESVQKNEATTGYLDSEANRNNQLTPLEAEKLRTEAQLAPIKVQTEQTLASAALNRAKAEALKQQNDADAANRLAIQLTDHESAKNTASQIISSLTPSDPNQPVDPAAVSQGISQLESNFHLLTKAAFKPSMDLDKPNDISADEDMLAQVGDLSYQAERTGDPNLVRRAKSLQDRYANVVNQRNNSLSKTGKNPVVFNAPESSTSTTLTEDLAKSAGVDLNAAPSLAPAANTDTPNVSVDHTQQYLSGAAAPNAQSSNSETPFEINYPQSPLPAPPPSLDPTFHQAEADKPIAQRLLTEGVPKSFDEKVKKLQNEQIALGSKKEDAARFALASVKASVLSPADEVAFRKIQQSAQDARVYAQRLRDALSRIQNLSSDGKVDTELGPQKALARFNTKVLSYVPLFSGSPQTQAMAESREEIDKVGQGELLTRIAGTGFGTKMIDTIPEKKALTEISSAATPARLVQALEVLEAKAQQVQDVEAILSFYQATGRKYSDGENAAYQFQEENPSTVSNGIINRQPFVVRNRQKQNVYDWLTKKLHLDNGGRDRSGRVIASPPVDPSKISSQLHRQTGAQEIPLKEDGTPVDAHTITPDKSPVGPQSLLDRATSLFEPEEAKAEEPSPEEIQPLPARASDIPDKQPDGVNEATVRRVTQAESSSRPNAIAYDDSGNIAGQGLMGLVRSTGKQMWNELGYPGSYNPYDPEKNVAMGTHYLNKLLPWFDNDTRLALAAYTVGPGTLSKAYQLAAKHTGDTSWDSVKHYLTPEAAKQAIPYVKKIMGDDGEAAAERKTVTPQETPSVLASIPTQAGRNAARANLSDEGMSQLKDVSDIRNLQGSAGTILEPIITALLSADPFEPTDAQAQGPEDSKMAGTATPGEHGALDTPTKPDYSEFYKQAVFAGSNASPVWQGLNSVLDPEVQAISLGAARTALAGGMNDIGALLRMAIHGEDWSTAIQKTDEISKAVEEANPGWYLTGELGGLPLATTSAGLAGKALRTVTGIKKAAAVSEVTPQIIRKAPSIAAKLKTAAGGGAIFGGVQGFNEGRGGFENRLEEGLQGAEIGAAAGGIFQTGIELAGGALKVAGKAVEHTPLKGLLGNLSDYLRDKTGASPRAESFTGAKKQIIRMFQGIPPKTWINDAAEKLYGTDNPEYKLINAAPSGKVKDFLDAAVKSPESTSKMETTAEQAYAGDKETKALSQRQRVVEKLDTFSNDVTSSEANRNLADTIDKKLGKLHEERDQRITNELDRNTNDVTSAQANKAVGKAITDKQNELYVERKNAADPAYAGARESLPEINTRRRPARHNVSDPTLGDIYDVHGNLIGTGMRGKHINTSTPTRGFVSKEVEAAMANPQVAAAIDQAHQSIDKDNLLPDNSLDILQFAKIKLAGDAAVAKGPLKHSLNEAANELRTAMHNESPAYEAADLGYAADSKNLEKFHTPAAEALAELHGDVLNSDTPRIFKLGTLELENLMKELSPEQRQAFKDATRTYVLDRLEEIGPRSFGEAQKLPSFAKAKFGEKAKIILGNQEGQRLADLLDKESSIQGSSALTKLAKPGTNIPNSDTAQLFGLGTKEIKDAMNGMSAAELQNFKDAVRTHILETLDARPTREPKTAQAFPDFTTGEETEKIKLILGNDVAAPLLKQLAEEKNIAMTSGDVLRKGAQTYTRGAYNAERAKNATVEGAVEAAVTGGTGLAIGNMALAAYGFGVKGLRTIQKFLTSNGLSTDAKYAEEKGDILLNDKKAGLSFLEQVYSSILKNNPALVPEWEKTLKKVAAGGAARAGGQLATLKPESQKGN